jgi:hypothetical protein
LKSYHKMNSIIFGKDQISVSKKVTNIETWSTYSYIKNGPFLNGIRLSYDGQKDEMYGTQMGVHKATDLTLYKPIRGFEIRMHPRSPFVSSMSVYTEEGQQIDLNEFRYNPNTHKFTFILDPEVSFHGFFGKSRRLRI